MPGLRDAPRAISSFIPENADAAPETGFIVRRAHSQGSLSTTRLSSRKIHVIIHSNAIIKSPHALKSYCNCHHCCCHTVLGLRDADVRCRPRTRPPPPRHSSWGTAKAVPSSSIFFLSSHLSTLQSLAATRVACSIILFEFAGLYKEISVGHVAQTKSEQLNYSTFMVLEMKGQPTSSAQHGQHWGLPHRRLAGVT